MPDIDYKLPHTKSQLFNYQLIANENSDETISLYLIDRHNNNIEPSITEKTVSKDRWDAGVRNESINLIQQMKIKENKHANK